MTLASMHSPQAHISSLATNIHQWTQARFSVSGQAQSAWTCQCQRHGRDAALLRQTPLLDTHLQYHKALTLLCKAFFVVKILIRRGKWRYTADAKKLVDILKQSFAINLCSKVSLTWKRKSHSPTSPRVLPTASQLKALLSMTRRGHSPWGKESSINTMFPLTECNTASNLEMLIGSKLNSHREDYKGNYGIICQTFNAVIVLNLPWPNTQVPLCCRTPDRDSRVTLRAWSWSSEVCRLKLTPDAGQLNLQISFFVRRSTPWIWPFSEV